MRFDIVTIFPDAFTSYLDTSILRRAREKRLIEVRFRNPRDFAADKRRTVDDKPYGGGAGMVMMAEPIVKAAYAALRGSKKQEAGNRKTEVIILSAKGKQFNQRMAYDWAKKYKQLVLISGRYEGIDERVKTIIHDSPFIIHEISVGPYVLTDGEVAAMAIISAVSRLIPGVIRLESLQEESHRNLLLRREKDAVTKKGFTLSEQSESKGLEYPHYTRPETLRWKGKAYRAPKVLLSGDHGKIAAWRKRFMQKSKA